MAEIKAYSLLAVSSSSVESLPVSLFALKDLVLAISVSLCTNISSTVNIHINSPSRAELVTFSLLVGTSQGETVVTDSGLGLQG